MASVRRMRCIVFSSLPVLGVMLLLLGMVAKQLNYGNLASCSKSIVETFQWGVIVDDEHVMLLKPEKDESRLVRLILADEIISSHTKSQIVNKAREYPTGLLNLASPEVSFDSDLFSGNLLNAKVQGNKHVKATLPSRKQSGNSTEDLEGQFFQAIGPAAEPSAPKDNKIHILIVTNRRSGSSFLGQFFNQNPSVFFQFEPLKLTEWKQEFYPDRIEYLRHLVKCEFNKTPYLEEFYNHEPLHRSSSRVMSDPPLCNLSYLQPLSDYRASKCEPLETVSLMQACRKKQHQAIKLIRLYSISSLEPLAFDPSINLRVVHLVRDPRGTHVSKSEIPRAQVSLKLGKSLDSDISYLCRRINRNLAFVRSQPAWLQGKYKLVRYEDIARHPQKLAQEIYDFTGLGRLPQEILDWIKNNTQRSDIYKKSIRKKADHYSTARNASQVAEAWRSRVPLQVVLRMQTFCRDTMKDLGYLEVRTVEELANMSNSLVAELPVS